MITFFIFIFFHRIEETIYRITGCALSNIANTALMFQSIEFDFYTNHFFFFFLFFTFFRYNVQDFRIRTKNYTKNENWKIEERGKKRKRKENKRNSRNKPAC